MNAKKVTISKIAELCGVSRQVVSAVLLGNKGTVGFSEQTRSRVEESAQKLNFRPNRTWLNATRNRHGSIGVLLKNIHMIPGAGNVSGIVTESKRQGFLTTLDLFSNNEIPQFVREDVVDGLLLFEDLGDDIDAMIREYKIPVVYININNFNRPGCLNYNEAGLMDQLAQRFKEKGKSQIALINTSDELFYELRQKALAKACSKLNLPDAVSVNLTHRNIAQGFYEESLEEIKGFLKKYPAVDAIIIERDKFAPNLYQALRDMGRSIPNDVSVVSIQNDPRIHKLLDPHLSSCTLADNVQPDVLGIQLLCEAIRTREPVPSQLLNYEIIERNSI